MARSKYMTEQRSIGKALRLYRTNMGISVKQVVDLIKKSITKNTHDSVKKLDVERLKDIEQGEDLTFMEGMALMNIYKRPLSDLTVYMKEGSRDE